MCACVPGSIRVRPLAPVSAPKLGTTCLKTDRALDRFVSKGVVMGAARMAIPVDTNLSSALVFGV